MGYASNKLTTSVAEVDAYIDGLNKKITDQENQIAALKQQIANGTKPATGARFLVGGATGGNADPSSLEKKAGAPFGIRRTYHAHDVAAVVNTIKADIAAGRAASEVSMKVPNWQAATTGAEDAWAVDAAAKIEAAIKGTSHLVRFVINHEPENDTGTNVGNSATGRDNWKAMQTRLAPMFDKPGIEFGVILMGYHQFAGEKALWNLEACVPKTPAVKWVGFDIYEEYGVKGSVTWKPFETTYFQPIQKWCQANKKFWTMSESGVTAVAFAKRPSWFSDMFTLMHTYGGTSFSYFNTNLNSVAGWQMEPDSLREKAFLAEVKKRAV